MVRALARMISAQGRHEDAEKLSRAVVDIYEKTGTAKESFSLAIARSQLAAALVNQERWQEAVVEYETINTALLSEPEYHRRRFSTKFERAIALLNVDRTEEARDVAQAAVEKNRAAVGEKHGKTALARGVLAMTLTRLGDHQAALASFRQAVPILISRSRQATDEDSTQATRSLHLQWILESYLELLGDLTRTAKATPGLDAAAEAFRISQVARAGRVQTALAASSARAAARDPDLAELVRREQDAQKQVAALYGLLAVVRSVPTAQQDAAAVKDLKIRIDRLRSARAAIAEEISARFPDYWDLVDPRPATIAETRSSLHPGGGVDRHLRGAPANLRLGDPKDGCGGIRGHGPGARGAVGGGGDPAYGAGAERRDHGRHPALRRRWGACPVQSPAGAGEGGLGRCREPARRRPRTARLPAPVAAADAGRPGGRHGAPVLRATGTCRGWCASTR